MSVIAKTIHVASEPAHWDEMSGKPLEPKAVANARKEELAELEKHKVFVKVPITECWRVTGAEPVGTRWIDINKGDDDHPEYRSRLVAQEINDHSRQDLFATTPPNGGEETVVFHGDHREHRRETG